MRSRNIKPGFFKNDLLAECDPLARILFAGLWCLADRKGRLEYRSKKIKVELLPYDNCDVDGLIKQLSDGGFITTYVVNNENYIEINEFLKHQTPHIKEQASTIPAPDKNGTSTGVAHLIPDSLNLIPDSLNPQSDTKRIQPKPALLKNHKERFEESEKQELKDLVSQVYVKHPKFAINLFLQNHNRDHPRAILHTLRSLMKANGEVDNAMAYCEAVMKIENGKYNARDSEAEHEERKKPLGGEMEAMKSIFGRLAQPP